MGNAKYGKAVRNTIIITVYSPEPLYDSEADDEVEGFPFLDRVIYEMTYGHAVGSYAISESKVVKGEALRNGLSAIGNDGTFFAEDDD